MLEHGMKFALACIMTSALVGVGSAEDLPDPEEAAYPAIERFVEVLETVRKRHPDADKLAYERLVNHALEGMLAGLDPFSSFIHPEMAAMMKDEDGFDPEVRSLGLSIGMRDDGPYVAAVAPLGAAADAGVLPGSALKEIDGVAVEGGRMDGWMVALRRPAGVETVLKLKSPAAPQPVEVKLAHRVVDDRSVAESKLLDPEHQIGFLRLAGFHPNSAREVTAALDDLEDQGMKRLILDLRHNPGGSLDETVRILGLFLPPDTAVVTTRGRDGETGAPLRTPKRQRRKRDYPMCVLIDRMSASASELTAGALQDLKRATIVGETSFGKGSVQNIIPMGGGTALRLTIATYHTPSGNTPHRKGITPDIVVDTDGSARTMAEKRRRLGNLPPEERAEVETWKDPVMAAAVTELLK